MKRIFFCIIILLAGMSSVSAQSEMPADTVRTAVRGEASPEGMSPSEKELLPDVKNYDGFLLDMGLMNLSAPTLPKFTLLLAVAAGRDHLCGAGQGLQPHLPVKPERDLFTRPFEHILTQQLPVFQFESLRTDGLLGLY